jgi:hypothetical protein
MVWVSGYTVGYIMGSSLPGDGRPGSAFPLVPGPLMLPEAVDTEPLAAKKTSNRISGSIKRKIFMAVSPCVSFFPVVV